MKKHRLFSFLYAGLMMWMTPILGFSEDALPEDTKLIDVNCAGIEQLCCLPEIDHQLAKKIVKYRIEKGLFKSKHDLLLVPGITTVLLDKLSPWLMEFPSNSCTMPDSHPGDHDWEEQPVKSIPNC